MKFLLALVAYILILWGWRKLAGWINPAGGRKEEVGGKPKQHPDKYINPDDIEDAAFTEIRNNHSKE